MCYDSNGLLCWRPKKEQSVWHFGTVEAMHMYLFGFASLKLLTNLPSNRDMEPKLAMVNCSFIVGGAETFHFHRSVRAAKANSTLESREIASCAKLQKQN